MKGEFFTITTMTLPNERLFPNPTFSSSQEASSQLIDGEEPEQDTFKILVATDNHLGYLEKDPVRGDDSFNAFEEILQQAVKSEVKHRKKEER